MRKKLLFSFIFLIGSYLHAEVSHGVLEKYPNRVFVGTGIRSCINIARAFNADFIEVYSMEEDPVLVEHSQHVIPLYFQEKPRKTEIIEVLQGNPATDLKKIINNI